MKKQPELTERTRRNLIDAYFELAHSGEKGTVDQITRKAGYNRCTFYRYFSDTRDMLDQVENEICGELTGALKQSQVSGAGEAVHSLADVYTAYGKYISVLLGKYGDPSFREKMKTEAEMILSQQLGLTAEQSPKMSLTAEFVLSAVLGTILKWFQLEMPISTVELEALITKLISNGVDLKSDITDTHD